jgi:D-sedoheptulose 7-phosphate isomerase
VIRAVAQDARLARVEEIFDEAIRLHGTARERGDALVQAAEAIVAALQGGGKLLVFGNGGSAADAEHLVAELVGRFERDRRPLPAVALTSDSSVVTSIANDCGYEQVFARQVEALGAPGDVAIAISTSGRSPNVLAAAAVAKRRGLTVIAMTGRDGGALGAAADVHLNVPHEVTARVQEVQRTQMHAICALVEDGIA